MKFILKLLGWLFSNLFLIVLVLALCYAYVYWDDPFGKDTPAGRLMAAFPAQFDSASELIADWSQSASGPAAPGAPAAVTPAARPAEAPAAKQPEAGPPPAEKTVSFAADADFPEQGSAPDTQQAGTARPALAGDVFVPPEIEDALNQLHNDGSVEDVAVMQQADKPARQLIIDARRAFYRRDYEASIAAYKQLIASEQDNFDAYGELGNVYFTRGETELAAEAYYQAASIMITQGHSQRAASLIGFLSTVDAEKAKQLGEQLVSDE